MVARFVGQVETKYNRPVMMTGALHTWRAKAPLKHEALTKTLSAQSSGWLVTDVF